MFGGIARRYDLLNHVLSLNADAWWRRRAARAVALGGSGRVLDLCGGTGDLSVATARAEPGALVVCCDFAHPMLTLAGRKFARKGLADRCLRVEADGLRLPFAPDTFDAVTVGFGVRNFADLDRGLSEIRRVLRPGGRLVVLEFSTPTDGWPGRIYRFYLSRVLPRIGDSASGKTGPYRYLARTIADFPDPPTLAGRLREAGFAAVGWTALTFGIVCVHVAVKGA
jgi:demethylmenaquinone methyltransferase/2-methoxy-6-polyprenyl-1,4-benzoquinol methylase